jgi:hypothetical protein
MIEFFDKKILYFATWPDSFGDGINNIKHMYYLLNENRYRSILHVNINSVTNRCVGWMLNKDNLVDRIYIHPEVESSVNYLHNFDTEYTAVYFRDLPISNHEEVLKFFTSKHNKCYALGVQFPNKISYTFEKPLENKDVFKFFKTSFKEQKTEIFKLIDTSKVAILMPFSTRIYANLHETTILKVCDILISKGYTVLLCGEMSSPYHNNNLCVYNVRVNKTLELLRQHTSDKIINLLGMGASKIAELSEYCNLILYASTGAIQMSYYNYAKCPWIILENGRECMMNGLSNIFSDTKVNILTCDCKLKYCQYELENNINCEQKIKDCNNYVKCMKEEFNFDLLEKMI